MSLNSHGRGLGVPARRWTLCPRASSGGAAGEAFPGDLGMWTESREEAAQGPEHHTLCSSGSETMGC